jgi:hypothetical protein
MQQLLLDFIVQLSNFPTLAINAVELHLVLKARALT